LSAIARRTWILIVGATLFHGILAGVTVDRGLVGLQAWHELGVLAWANYSRSADLGNGLVLYPTLAIGGALLTLAAAVGLVRQPARKRSIAVAVYVSATLALAGLLLTFKAAPFMLSLRSIGNDDLAHLQQAFDSFWFWSSIRGVLQVLAFGGNLWSLAEILRTAKINDP
jgi:hypothetical protein